MKPYYSDSAVTLYHGDSREVLAALPPASVDAVVSDPPYELAFMGKHWDGTGIAFDATFWADVLRVLKPGGHLLACGGTRTYHRMGAAIEDAGFEVRDCLAWLYGSGFPKSLNLGEGLGTALKPAYEPIVLARKPFKGSVKSNVKQYGTGALNIDACRIEPVDADDYGRSAASAAGVIHAAGEGYGFRARPADAQQAHDLGRWPANVVLDDLAALVLDEQSGELASNSGDLEKYPGRTVNGEYAERSDKGRSDSGGASRFFYVAKPSREERDYGIYDLGQKSAGEATARQDGTAGLNSPRAGAGRTGGARNFHPTVKPVELMRWLVRLVTPPNGIVLDPFLGSGTTGMAAKYEQRRFIGIERDADYMAIAERRIRAVTPLFNVEASA